MSSTNREVGGSIPGSSILHVEVSLGKILSTELPPDASSRVKINTCVLHRPPDVLQLWLSSE